MSAARGSRENRGSRDRTRASFGRRSPTCRHEDRRAQAACCPHLVPVFERQQKGVEGLPHRLRDDGAPLGGGVPQRLADKPLRPEDRVQDAEGPLLSLGRSAAAHQRLDECIDDVVESVRPRSPPPRLLEVRLASGTASASECARGSS